MSNSKMKVISSDGQEFEIGYDIAKQSKMFKSYFDEEGDEPFQLPHISGSILKSVIEFCNQHKNDPEQEIIDDDDDDDDDDNTTNKNSSKPKQTTVISEWDHKFVQRFAVREEKLFDIITAASYLGIPSLLHVLCKTFITMIRGKSSKEIQDLFKVCEELEQVVNELTVNDNKSSSKKT